MFEDTRVVRVCVSAIKNGRAVLRAVDSGSIVGTWDLNRPFTGGPINVGDELEATLRHPTQLKVDHLSDPFFSLTGL